jgi:hypothetical protein
MNIICKTPSPSGAYPPINSILNSVVPDGWLRIEDSVDTSVMQTKAGFVKLTVEEEVVTAMIANDKAYQAYLKGLPVPPLADVQKDKLTEINAACDAAITAGCDVTLSDGTAGHISLSIPDQINLTTAKESVKAGGSGYAYHLDGSLCEVYPAADIAIMAKAATAHILYHQTYCNHARMWVKRCTAVADVQAITYGTALPDDLATHMAAVIAAAGGTSNGTSA